MLGAESVFGFDVPFACKELSCSHPSKQLLYSAFASSGLPIVQAYMKPSLYKTSATPKHFYQILKAWKQHELRTTLKDGEEELKESDPAFIAKLLKNISPESYRYQIMGLPAW